MGEPDLNKILIPLPELRQWIIDRMREGDTTYPLGDFLAEVQRIYRNKRDSEQSLGAG